MVQKLNLETLSEDRLRKAVDHELYMQGQRLAQDGRVLVSELTDNFANCIVQDKHPYRVEIKISKNYLLLKCDCRYAYRGLVCEHGIAACLTIRDTFQRRLPPTWRSQINLVMDSQKNKITRKISKKYLLFFGLQQSDYYDFPSWKIVPFQLPPGVVNRLNLSPDDPNEGVDFTEILNPDLHFLAHLRTPQQILNPDECLNCSRDVVLIANMLIERDRISNYYNARYPIHDYLMLLTRGNSPLYLSSSKNPLGTKIRTVPEAGELYISIDKDVEGIRLGIRVVVKGNFLEVKFGKASQLHVINVSPLWVLVDSVLLLLSEKNSADLLEIFQDAPEIFVPAQDEELFQKKYYQPLAEKFPLTGNLVEWRTIDAEPIKRVYLAETSAGIQAELRFGYDNVEVHYEQPLQDETIIQCPGTWTLNKVQRKIDLEQQFFNDLTSAKYGLKRTPNPSRTGSLSLRSRVHPIDFLMKCVPELIVNNFEVYGEEGLTSTRVNRNNPMISFNVSSGIDWFDVKAIVNYGEFEVSLKEIRRALRKNERYIKLPDGSIGSIPDSWVDEYKHLFNLGHETEDGVRISRQQIGLLDQVLSNVENVTVDQTFTEYRQKLIGFSGISSRNLPKNFWGELRPYQKAGVDWLHFLRDFRFGGCLADDMGLGKTIQVLVFLQSLKENGIQAPGEIEHNSHSFENIQKNPANLIVVPRSLLVNWQREAARFTPALKIFEYFEINRPKDVTLFDQYDLIITTYGIMLRDVALLSKYTFEYIILDESQAIKNPVSQTARSVRLLRANHRLVMTGTPVENSTQELWSQFSFLNPGMLGSLEYFREEFATPIEKKNDDRASSTLRKMVFPFILRRTKDQVAPELPSRTERVLYCDMEAAQRKLYNRTRDYYRGVILGMLDKEGINATRMRILEGLLRLRQISNHPKLVDEKFHGESGKFELLVETIRTLQAENHKALIFSQFVQMLRIVRHSMDEHTIPYVYLDGHTRNRMELVDLYQNNPSIPFFLISLKAGGQGLNLTAADYVIHIDPWWNPAVEMQASDRTHRIGQDKPVFIFKLITRDSVEEKILLLQERKKALVDQIITTEASFFKSLSREDVEMLFK